METRNSFSLVLHRSHFIPPIASVKSPCWQSCEFHFASLQWEHTGDADRCVCFLPFPCSGNHSLPPYLGSYHGLAGLAVREAIRIVLLNIFSCIHLKILFPSKPTVWCGPPNTRTFHVHFSTTYLHRGLWFFWLQSDSNLPFQVLFFMSTHW